MEKKKRKRQYVLSSKIIILLAITIFAILGIYSMIFSGYYSEYENRVIGEENVRTLHSVENSLSTIIKNADDYSKMVLADNTIQQQMRKGDLFWSPTKQAEVTNKIYTIFQFADYIEAIWIIDQKGQKLTVGKSASISVEDESSRYTQLRKPYGEYAVIVREGEEERRQLSLVRSYNDLECFSSIGIVGVDISYNAFDQLVSNIIDEEDEQLVILNEENETVYSRGNLVEEDGLRKAAEEIEQAGGDVSSTASLQKKQYLMGGIKNSETGWKMIRYMPIKRGINKDETTYFVIVSLVSVGIAILICAALISRMLTGPIQQLLHCMKGSEDNSPDMIYSKPLLSEFRVLFYEYNQMVEQIRLLIQSTIDKQRRIRQVELNEIQEQMKPHFLYNTLDSIQALAMMGDSQSVCVLVERLGDFYRKSVSGGKELLTVAEEFKIAQDYADIMEVRFENAFRYISDIDESCGGFMLPKLTLQPLVENAFLHGVRKNDRFGEIIARAELSDGRLHILVADNGRGIPEDVLDELASEKEPERGKSLGLRGTIERLRLLYGDQFSYQIRKKEMSEIHLFIGIEGLREKENEQVKGNNRR